MMNNTGFIRDILFYLNTVPDSESGKHPYNLPVFYDLERLSLHSKVTYITGENGMGKSTLIEAVAIAAGFNAEGGTVNFNFSTRNTSSGLHKYIRLSRGARRSADGFFLRAESFYNVATNIDDLADGILNFYGGISLHEQSHGESFTALMMNRFGGNGLYIFDEPEAALSAQRQFMLLRRMHELIQSGSQFIIATHSPIVLAYPDALIYDITEKGIQPVTYEDSDQYVLMKYFINNHKNYIEDLLS